MDAFATVLVEQSMTADNFLPLSGRQREHCFLLGFEKDFGKLRVRQSLRQGKRVERSKNCLMETFSFFAGRPFASVRTVISVQFRAVFQFLCFCPPSGTSEG
jgi:hypothetical protein